MVTITMVTIFYWPCLNFNGSPVQVGFGVAVHAFHVHAPQGGKGPVGSCVAVTAKRETPHPSGEVVDEGANAGLLLQGMGGVGEG